MNESFKADATDIAILNALMQDCRLSFRQLAKKTRVSVATVANRINKLKQASVLKGFSALIDFEKLGYQLNVLIDIRVARGKLFEVEKKIASHHNVAAVYDVTGSFDVIALAKFKNRKGLDAFVKKIQTYDFIERTETRLVLNTIKEESIKI